VAGGAETDLRAAWVGFLGRWTWELFGSHTFREDAHPEAAYKRFRVFVSKLNRELYGPRWYKHPERCIRWVCAMERQQRGIVHFHSLLSGPGLVELWQKGWQRQEDGRWSNQLNELWNFLAGFARIERIDSAEAVRRYVSKYVVKGGEIDLGGAGMPDRVRSGLPARVDRSWLKTSLGRASAWAILETVTTPDELRELRSWAAGDPGSNRGTEDLRRAVRQRALAARVGYTPAACS
jgi:hypothetical protein